MCFDINVYKGYFKHTNVNFDTTSLLEEDLIKCRKMSERKYEYQLFLQFICTLLIFYDLFDVHS